ncbi:uncharacterized protein [Cicer arietinum]|uniref:Uncharacterized protein LOC101492991 isoform X2 n=1 Tax=Cicer arietinum TaxID=3827 RepID=A0A1S2Y7R0_CICAR|nr:uncharacterized protein LOC101492991 isoform X2 [Cicer arietinum]
MEEGTSSSSSSRVKETEIEKEKNHTHTRPSLKSDNRFNNYQFWKENLRDNCFKRVRQDRTRLLWKFRLSSPSLNHHQDLLDTAFRDIVSDEFHKIIKNDDDDLLWDDQVPHTTYQGDCQEILLEMQRIFYEDLKFQPPIQQESAIDTWEDEVDDYLARAVYDHMHLNADKTCTEQIWCPLCKQGELKEHHNLIYCTHCKLQLTKANELTLDFLRDRLAEVHIEHLDRGCRLKPRFCMKTKFNLTALYITCEGCDTFEVVI